MGSDVCFVVGRVANSLSNSFAFHRYLRAVWHAHRNKPQAVGRVALSWRCVLGAVLRRWCWVVVANVVVPLARGVERAVLVRHEGCAVACLVSAVLLFLQWLVAWLASGSWLHADGALASLDAFAS